MLCSYKYLKRYTCINHLALISLGFDNLQGAKVLQQVHWFRIVLDEGHKIKNPNAKRSLAICSFQSQRRWILSGNLKNAI
jgi:SNF2 family DNA or RNA helicase